MTSSGRSEVFLSFSRRRSTPVIVIDRQPRGWRAKVESIKEGPLPDQMPCCVGDVSSGL